MDTRALTALRGSIAKWQAIVNGTGTDEGTSNCPLCQEFYYEASGLDACFGCPVSTQTGEICCDNTPYRAAYYALDGKGKLANTPAKVAAAQDELDFLISLLPTTEGDNEGDAS